MECSHRALTTDAGVSDSVPYNTATSAMQADWSTPAFSQTSALKYHFSPSDQENCAIHRILPGLEEETDSEGTIDLSTSSGEANSDAASSCTDFLQSDPGTEGSVNYASELLGTGASEPANHCVTERNDAQGDRKCSAYRKQSAAPSTQSRNVTDTRLGHSRLWYKADRAEQGLIPVHCDFTNKDSIKALVDVSEDAKFLTPFHSENSLSSCNHTHKSLGPWCKEKTSGKHQSLGSRRMFSRKNSGSKEFSPGAVTEKRSSFHRLHVNATRTSHSSDQHASTRDDRTCGKTLNKHLSEVKNRLWDQQDHYIFHHLPDSRSYIEEYKDQCDVRRLKQNAQREPHLAHEESYLAHRESHPAQRESDNAQRESHHSTDVDLAVYGCHKEKQLRLAPMCGSYPNNTESSKSTSDPRLTVPALPGIRIPQKPKRFNRIGQAFPELSVESHTASIHPSFVPAEDEVNNKTHTPKEKSACVRGGGKRVRLRYCTRKTEVAEAEGIHKGDDTRTSEIGVFASSRIAPPEQYEKTVPTLESGSVPLTGTQRVNFSRSTLRKRLWLPDVAPKPPSDVNEEQVLIELNFHGGRYKASFALAEKDVHSTKWSAACGLNPDSNERGHGSDRTLKQIDEIMQNQLGTAGLNWKSLLNTTPCKKSRHLSVRVMFMNDLSNRISVDKRQETCPPTRRNQQQNLLSEDSNRWFTQDMPTNVAIHNAGSQLPALKRDRQHPSPLKSQTSPVSRQRNDTNNRVITDQSPRNKDGKCSAQATNSTFANCENSRPEKSCSPRWRPGKRGVLKTPQRTDQLLCMKESIEVRGRTVADTASIQLCTQSGK